MILYKNIERIDSLVVNGNKRTALSKYTNHEGIINQLNASSQAESGIINLLTHRAREPV